MRPHRNRRPGMAVLGPALLILAALPARPAAAQAAQGLTLQLASTRVTSCGSVAGVVTLSAPTPGGVTVSLASDTAPVQVPDHVEIAPGQVHGVFVVSVGAVRSRVRARITARHGTHASTALLTVRPPVAYAVEDLGTLGGAMSMATAINAGGQVAGVSQTPDGLWRGFITDAGGTMRPAATGAPVEAARAVHVAALNDAGQVAGWLEDASGRPSAFVTDANGVAALVNVAGAVASQARALNNAGEVAGHFTPPTGQDRAFWMSAGGSVTDLGPFANGSFSYAFGITSEGSVVGFGDDGNQVYSFRTQPGGRVTTAARVGPHAYGYAVNEAGDTAGELYGADGFFHAFRSGADGTIRNLGAFPGHDAAAYALNERGDVVGAAYLLGGPEGHAFLFTDADGLRDLNDLIPLASGWELLSARGINAAGQIAGYGRRNGAVRAFRLTPLSPPALHGDADGDGWVNADDVGHALRAGGGLTAAADSRAGDVAPSPGCLAQGFGDGRVDILDAVRILRRVRGLEPAWP